MDEKESELSPPSSVAEKAQIKESNQCIALGLGVGGLGAAAAAVSGAVCPLCVVVAPALVAVGVFRRFTAKKSDK